ncbi:MAG: glycoside hydrolase family 28 protein [Sedimentisphaerales bacterium]|nr:glycoside hydrolase family 28 protein [Sedimentisphaerales bacterium]
MEEKSSSYLKILSAIICLILLAGFVSDANAGWEEVPKILKRIVPPKFPDRDFNITDYGAVGDGKTDCTAAFIKAIKAANKTGGGRVVVPAGSFLTGAIHLKSNVNLYVSKGATIKFSDDPNNYLPAVYTRWEGVECMNYSPLVYAYKQKNIAITGEGTLDGQGRRWWTWKRGPGSQRDDRERLFEYGAKGVPVKKRLFGGGKLRPNMIEPYRCKNILIEGVTIKDGPFWHIHPVLSQNITIKGVTVEGPGPNNDGLDPECCKDVLIKECSFNTGDDCIAIKAGRNNDARRVNIPTENIIIQGCHMKDGHGGVVIGSEMTGGVRNVFAEDCIMDSPNLDRAVRLKTNAVRGGFIENVYVRNIEVGQVKEAVLKIDFYYQDIEKAHYKPKVRNVNLENITSQKSKHALWLRGLYNAPIRDVRLKNCVLDNNQNPNIIVNVENLILEDVKINGKSVSTADLKIEKKEILQKL